MADLNTLTANRAIVDNAGQPLPEFILLWQEVIQRLQALPAIQVLSEQAAQQQDVNLGLAYAVGAAQVVADEALAAGGGTARSGLSLTSATTNGATWVNAGTETLSTVSAGDLTIYNTGPIKATTVSGVTTGLYRIRENATTTVFTGSWMTQEAGTFGLVQNLSIEDTITFSSTLATTGSVTYDLEVSVTSGDDVDLDCYLFVRRA